MAEQSKRPKSRRARPGDGQARGPRESDQGEWGDTVTDRLDPGSPRFPCGGAPPPAPLYSAMGRAEAVAAIEEHYSGHPDRLKADLALACEGRAESVADLPDRLLFEWLAYLNLIVAEGRDFRRSP